MKLDDNRLLLFLDPKSKAKIGKTHKITKETKETTK
jgi:hypothetical protein